MAASGPWITLGRGPDHCRTACQRPAAPTSRQVGQFDDSVIDGASELLLYKRVPVV